MQTLSIKTETITLAQALKASGVADSGGQAKMVVREGMVRVNGEPETQPGRKLVRGDRFMLEGEDEWLVG